MCDLLSATIETNRILLQLLSLQSEASKAFAPKGTGGLVLPKRH